MVTEFLEKAKKFELDTYRNTPDLISGCIPFSGAPQKHPMGEDKILLIADPFSPQTFYYEFATTDIVGVEELPSLLTLEGESVTMARVWVRKGSLGVKSVPFVVEDLAAKKKRS